MVWFWCWTLVGFAGAAYVSVVVTEARAAGFHIGMTEYVMPTILIPLFCMLIGSLFNVAIGSTIDIARVETPNDTASGTKAEELALQGSATNSIQ